MAKFLIKANSTSWINDTSIWAAKNVTQEMYDARSEKGDVVEVMQDDKKYVFNEKPYFVVINVPELNYEKTKPMFEDRVYEEIVRVEAPTEPPIQKMRKKHKYHVPQSLVDEIIEKKGEITLTQKEFIGYISERSLSETNILQTQIVPEEKLIILAKEVIIDG